LLGQLTCDDERDKAVARGTLIDLASGEKLPAVELPPYGVVVAELSGAN
jgi:hypothetical protein